MKPITAIPKRFTAAGHSYDMDEDAWLTHEGLDGTEPELRNAWEEFRSYWSEDLSERLAAPYIDPAPLVDWEADLTHRERQALKWLRAARRKFDAVMADDPVVTMRPGRWRRLMRWRVWAGQRYAFATGDDPMAQHMPRFGPTLDNVFWLVVWDRVSPERAAHWLSTTPEHVTGAVRYGLARMARTLENVARHKKAPAKQVKNADPCVRQVDA